MRYRQLAFGIFVSIATSYVSPYVNPVVAQVQAQSINTSNLSSSVIRLNNIRPTTNGLMLTVNANPQVRMQREDNPDRLIVDLQNTSLVKELHKANVPLNRFGVKQVRIAQFQNSPEITRLVFDLDSNDPNSKGAWQSQYIAATNTLLLTPANQVAQAIPIDENLTSARPIAPAIATANIAEVERLSFSSTGQLLIMASQPVNYATRLDRTSGTFNLTLANAKISANLQRPSLAANSPIERIRMTQVGNSVEIGIKMIAGWQVRDTPRLSNQQIKLQVSLNNALNSSSANPSISQNPALPIDNTPNNAPVNAGDRRRGVIFVDAGHGGRDPGAVANGVQEKDIVLPISLTLGTVLQGMGYTVYYTRTNDVEIDLEPRVASAERINADLFVSIHANALAANNSGVSGVETYHSRTSTVGRELASYVHSQIIAGTGALDRSVRGAGFYVIARTSMPAILVETGFVTNPTEARNLSSPNYQKLMADAIARGIDQFMRVRGR